MDEERNVNPNDVNQEVSTKKEEKNKAAKSGFFARKFGEFKGEYKKIIWPSRKDLVKESLTVIITCAIFGVVICSIDWVLQSGYQLLMQYISL